MERGRSSWFHPPFHVLVPGGCRFLFEALECRHISGNRQMADQLEKALDLEIEERRDELLNLLHQTVRIREAALEETDSWLEPDLEQACGGLEDINAIRTAGRIAANMRNLEDAIFRGYLTRQEVDFLQQAEKFYACLVSMIHGTSGTSDSVLRMNRQDYPAGKLGYSGEAGLLPVERLLQQVHRFLHGVQCISQEFWARLQESREGVPDAVPNGFLETGLLLRGRKIFIQTDRYPATPSNIVRLFHLSARHHLEFANMTRQWIHHHKGRLSSCAGDPRVKEELLELLRWDEPELPVIRRFYNLGLMAELIPEINGVHGLVQHDSFHLYPIHEHHLRTLMELKKLFRGDYTESEAVLSEIAGGMRRPSVALSCGPPPRYGQEHRERPCHARRRDGPRHCRATGTDDRGVEPPAVPRGSTPADHGQCVSQRLGG